LYSFFQKKQSQEGEADFGAPEGFLKAAQFAEQLLIERARADRAGAKFSMLALHIGAPKVSSEYPVAERVLAHVLNKVSRVIDTKGVYRDGLALIMPYTPSDKATVVWTKIQDSYQRRIGAEMGSGQTAPEIQCEVYAYPSSDSSPPLA